MSMESPKTYTVCFLFTDGLDSVLLQEKSRTEFAGKLNGVGGKVEAGETPMQCAVREIQEETSVTNLDRLTWLGTVDLPHDCGGFHPDTDRPDTPACRLHYYAAVLRDANDVLRPPGGEALRFMSVADVIASPATDARFAGNGDLQYFVNRAACMLSGRAC